MKTSKLFPKSVVLIMLIALSMTSVSAAVVKHNYAKQESAIHAALEQKGFTHITQFSITKSDVHQSKYFVNFTNDKIVYDAYFTKKGELIEVYKVAQM
jgi:hypothetical protein